MKIEQRVWTKENGWMPEKSGNFNKDVQLVLVFGSTSALKNLERFNEIKSDYPNADVFGCSTAGEVCGTQVLDDSIIATAVNFEYTEVKSSRIIISDVENSFQAGKQLAHSLDKQGLKHVIVLSEGTKINGSDLVRGLTQHLPDEVTLTGGLSGDGARFEETIVVWNGEPANDAVACLGFYGDRLKIGYGSLGGWDTFGPYRLITRSEGNVLYELDGKSALELYKKYLGEHAKGLPATGLLFPLNLKVKEGDRPVVRTILSIDEKDQSMTFAGDVPEGAYVQLMKANFDRLIDGATGAAKICHEAVGSKSPDLAILISCVGRKMVLKQRVEEEVEAVSEVLGENTVLTGFYSYGEISPFIPGAKCELHNQTMTITTLLEE
ncbi:MAG: FIST N-terminal domain-containing protein [Candidatus Desulfaltia sp.]|nr:FIST N-terminal domain-containing protein [Candidatus Desulfaltia sp.]